MQPFHSNLLQFLNIFSSFINSGLGTKPVFDVNLSEILFDFLKLTFFQKLRFRIHFENNFSSSSGRQKNKKTSKLLTVRL